MHKGYRSVTRSRVASVTPPSTLSQRAGGLPPAVTAASHWAWARPGNASSRAARPAESRLAMLHRGPVERRAQAGGDRLGRADAPEMHVEQPGLLPQGVVVQRRHLDAVLG